MSGVASPLPRPWVRALLHPRAWRMAWRDSRAQGKRLVLFAVSIVFGMAALVAIHSLEATVEDAVEVQAKALLGADLHIASRQAIAPELLAKVTAPATRVS